MYYNAWFLDKLYWDQAKVKIATFFFLISSRRNVGFRKWRRVEEFESRTLLSPKVLSFVTKKQNSLFYQALLIRSIGLHQIKVLNTSNTQLLKESSLCTHEKEINLSTTQMEILTVVGLGGSRFKWIFVH